MKAAIYLEQEQVEVQEFPLEQISEAIQTAVNPNEDFNVTIKF